MENMIFFFFFFFFFFFVPNIQNTEKNHKKKAKTNQTKLPMSCKFGSDMFAVFTGASVAMCFQHNIVIGAL